MSFPETNRTSYLFLINSNTLKINEVLQRRTVLSPKVPQDVGSKVSPTSNECPTTVALCMTKLKTYSNKKKKKINATFCLGVTETLCFHLFGWMLYPHPTIKQWIYIPVNLLLCFKSFQDVGDPSSPQFHCTHSGPAVEHIFFIKFFEYILSDII